MPKFDSACSVFPKTHLFELCVKQPRILVERPKSISHFEVHETEAYPLPTMFCFSRSAKDQRQFFSFMPHSFDSHVWGSLVKCG